MSVCEYLYLMLRVIDNIDNIDNTDNTDMIILSILVYDLTLDYITADYCILVLISALH